MFEIKKRPDDFSQEVHELSVQLNPYFDPSSIKTVLDVGSRDATESINLKRCYPNAQIYAFECNPAAIELCKKNIIDHSDITLVTKAVSDIVGTLDFYAIDPQQTITAHADGNIGASSLLTANPAYPYEKYVQKKISVESVTLEKWAKEMQVNEIDILWMDLQGAELRAFRGMGNLIGHVKAIFTEIEFNEIYVNQPLFPEIDDYLTSRGFHLLKLYYAGWFGNALYIQEEYIHHWSLKTRMLYRECLTRSHFVIMKWKESIRQFRQNKQVG